jgi:hypothetical protein
LNLALMTSKTVGILRSFLVVTFNFHN